jgi:uncharacterized OsmC-like protein
MIELIWDSGRLATTTAPSGASATVGEGADFTPDDLIAIAAAGCLMQTFLRLAEEARLPLLSYAATARVAAGASALPRVVIRSFIVVAEPAVEGHVRDLLNQAYEASPVCRMLGDRVSCETDVRRLWRCAS